MSLVEVMLCLIMSSGLYIATTFTQLKLMHAVSGALSYALANQQIANLIEKTRHVGEGEREDVIALWIHQTQAMLQGSQVSVADHYSGLTIQIYWGGESAVTCLRTQIDHHGCLYVDV